MPGRKIQIETGHYYHVFNRGVAKLPTFTEKREYDRMIQLINYYRFDKTPLKYSTLLELSLPGRREIFKKLIKANKFLVEIHSFALMPNHFHLTLLQTTDKGISKFIANVINGYTKYVNTKDDRVGPLFQGKFKAILITDDDQLLHLSRYHHLNPYTAGIITTFEKLLRYPYSSLIDYIGEKTHPFVSTHEILKFFKSKKTYEKFVLNQADYQKSLGRLKKLTLEKPAKTVPAHLRGG